MSSPKKFKLLISIINFKTPEMTIACLQSVLEDCHSINAHVVVIDNDSNDSSVELISEWIQSSGVDDFVSLIASDVNLGFSGGHNLGLKFSDADYYLILNSDALLRKGFCGTILEAADQNKAAGLFSPRLEWENGEGQISHFRFHSPVSELIRAACSGPITRLFKKYDIPLDNFPAPENIGWASFACILLKREMVQQVGIMDDGYFLYFEDTEYCFRARSKGWKIYHVPQARAVHFRGGSAPVKSLTAKGKRLPAYYYESRTRFFYQAYGRLGLFAANLCWTLGRGISKLRTVLGKSAVKGIDCEYKDIWINFFTPLKDSRKPE